MKMTSKRYAICTDPRLQEVVSFIRLWHNLPSYHIGSIALATFLESLLDQFRYDLQQNPKQDNRLGEIKAQYKETLLEKTNAHIETVLQVLKDYNQR